MNSIFRRTPKKIKAKYICLFTFITASQLSYSHLPAYEGERVRNSNHFVTNGFSQPVRGECDIDAVGPTDPEAGSANIFLGDGNTPPNFFCNYTTQDDWTFERPVDIIEISRTPAPNPEDLGLTIEEGYIPCDVQSQNPFQCPREFSNPVDGTKINIPGRCVDLGQPDDPWNSDLPDGKYHCAVLPGAPRPRESSVLFSTLTGADDVDWGVYHYDPVYGQQPIVGAPQVPACSENLTTFVTFAYAGPLTMKDARSGEQLFKPLSEFRKLPQEVRDSLPENYGIRLKEPDTFYPTPRNPRLGYASGFAQNGWLLAPDSVVECIDNFEKCLADETGELSKHYNNNDIFFVDEDEKVSLYLMWWVDKPWWGFDNEDAYTPFTGRRSLTDVSITTGVIDQFIIGDYMNIQKSGPFSANGRYVHGRCTDPRRFNRADMTIETNE
ncbi:hypothetical protein [Pleionea sediminis]|uniref:hypothetical protein n=1 Tax=Pleionea sediminis TaxID=2569479 RepID=UPI001184E02F|nr:hypothetical protein [Pleionea sediminis]